MIYPNGQMSKHITRQIHSDAKNRRFALLFGSGDLRRYIYGEIMKYYTFILALFLFTSCASHNTNYVNPNSEMGKMMTEMNASARLFQNKPRINRALVENKGNAKCQDIKVSSLIEPGSKIGKIVYEYEVVALSEVCGEKRYLAIIEFRDSARTLMSSFKILNEL